MLNHLGLLNGWCLGSEIDLDSSEAGRSIDSGLYLGRSPTRNSDERRLMRRDTFVQFCAKRFVLQWMNKSCLSEGLFCHAIKKGDLIGRPFCLLNEAVICPIFP